MRTRVHEYGGAFQLHKGGGIFVLGLQRHGGCTSRSATMRQRSSRTRRRTALVRDYTCPKTVEVSFVCARTTVLMAGQARRCGGSRGINLATGEKVLHTGRDCGAEIIAGGEGGVYCVGPPEHAGRDATELRITDQKVPFPRPMPDRQFGGDGDRPS